MIGCCPHIFELKVIMAAKATNLNAEACMCAPCDCACRQKDKAPTANRTVIFMQAEEEYDKHIQMCVKGHVLWLIVLLVVTIVSLVFVILILIAFPFRITGSVAQTDKVFFIIDFLVEFMEYSLPVCVVVSLVVCFYISVRGWKLRGSVYTRDIVFYNQCACGIGLGCAAVVYGVYLFLIT